jgi:hypothetical protein
MRRRLPPEAGFAGREATRDAFCELPEEGVGWGTSGFPTLKTGACELRRLGSNQHPPGNSRSSCRLDDVAS